MKKSIILFLIALSSCISINKIFSISSSQSGKSKTEQHYLVYKIDSINNYYLIYASLGNDLFKIISKKERSLKKRNIFVGKSYKIELYQDYKVDNYLDVGGDILDDSTIINTEPDSIRTLSYAKNVRGLYVNK